MTFEFWPSLQLMAYAKVAQGILYTMDLEILKQNFICRGTVATDYIPEIEIKVSTIVVSKPSATFSHLSDAPTKSEEVKCMFLPTTLQKELVGVVMTMVMEVQKWFECHIFILRTGNLDLRNKIAWYSFGIIDRFKTARSFIQDENFSIKERFYLACKYYFEDDVQRLWRDLSWEIRHYFTRCLPCSRSMELWLQVLNGGTRLDWLEISFHETRSFFHDNYFGMRYYFLKLLSPEMRYLCIYSALNINRSHHFDLYSCLSQINTFEFNAMLTRLPTSRASEFFQSLLNWPLQIMFLDVISDFNHLINEEIFCDLIICIFAKLGMGFHDHLYIDLLKRFWNPVWNTQYKSCVTNDIKLNALLNYALECSTFDLTRYRYLMDDYFVM